MRLLFDQNLSYRLVSALSDLFPGSTHVRDAQLRDAEDEVVWNHALQCGLTIVSKDSDFHQKSFCAGHPPKVIWVRLGNCSTGQIAACLRGHFDDLLAFERDESASFLILG
jgi:predicted nuclease of predicted toxin-antitoxin system